MIYHVSLEKVSQISMLMNDFKSGNDLKILEENANQDLQHVCSCAGSKFLGVVRVAGQGWG